MRSFVFAVLLFLGIALVILSFGEIETILDTLRQANVWFVVLALLVLMGWFLMIGQMYRSIYHLLDMHESTLNLSLVATAANFINIVAPTAGMGGIALFAAEARRRGHPSGKATVAAALFLLFDLAAFMCILALGLIVLIRRNDLGAAQITASFLLLVIACVFAFLLYLGYRSATQLGSALESMARFVNRIAQPLIHRPYLQPERAHEFAREIAEGFSGLTEAHRSWVPPFLWGLLNKGLLMAILMLAFLAFKVPFSAGT
ncbi:MAG TPA: lysylphosphatidylglycerol synthase transmembrane domain-containing protein, partial [Anaerolineales bacterium]